MAVARSGPAVVKSEAGELAVIERWYREALDEATPPDHLRYEPVKLGPTWEWSDGWVLPEATLGWDVLAWCGMWLRHRQKPWQFTLEQARFILWYYAVDADGQFVYHSAALQRLKGWGKDPLAAAISASAILAPTIFDHWDGDRPVGRDHDAGWVDVVAVSLEQTKNTFKLFPSMLGPEMRRRFGVQVGKENIWALGDTRHIRAVTSSPLALEGGRASQIIRNETQNWNDSNGGHAMAGVIDGNAAKSEDGYPARMLDIFNAYRPGEDSVAQRMREGYEDTLGDPDAEDAADRPKIIDFGLMYDSLEAAPDAPLTLSEAPAVLEGVRGDAVWLNLDRIKKSIASPLNPPSESRRKWFNQVVAAEDSWVDPGEIDPLVDRETIVEDGEEIAVFFDGSKSDDATVLVGCRMSDGHVFTIGMWQRPPGRRGDGWVSPRNEIDAVVERTAGKYRMVGFFADPSHVLDDETMDRFWDPLVEQWHIRYRRQLRVWASGTRGGKGSSVMFDMTSRDRSRQFAEAVAFELEEIRSGNVSWDGDPRMRRHLLNARRYPVNGVVSIAKESRESRHKIDLAVGFVGARMVRRLVLTTKKKGGTVW